jgi:hypothetical protein
MSDIWHRSGQVIFHSKKTYYIFQKLFQKQVLFNRSFSPERQSMVTARSARVETTYEVSKSQKSKIYIRRISYR